MTIASSSKSNAGNARKILSFYRMNCGLTPPYTVLVDSETIRLSSKNGVYLKEALPNLIGPGQGLKLSVSNCTVRKLRSDRERKGDELFARRLERIPCTCSVAKKEWKKSRGKGKGKHESDQGEEDEEDKKEEEEESNYEYDCLNKILNGEMQNGKEDDDGEENNKSSTVSELKQQQNVNTRGLILLIWNLNRHIRLPLHVPVIGVVNNHLSFKAPSRRAVEQVELQQREKRRGAQLSEADQRLIDQAMDDERQRRKRKREQLYGVGPNGEVNTRKKKKAKGPNPLSMKKSTKSKNMNNSVSNNENNDTTNNTKKRKSRGRRAKSNSAPTLTANGTETGAGNASPGLKSIDDASAVGKEKEEKFVDKQSKPNISDTLQQQTKPTPENHTAKSHVVPTSAGSRTTAAVAPTSERIDDNIAKIRDDDEQVKKPPPPAQGKETLVESVAQAKTKKVDNSIEGEVDRRKETLILGRQDTTTHITVQNTPASTPSHIESCKDTTEKVNPTDDDNGTRGMNDNEEEEQPKKKKKQRKNRRRPGQNKNKVTAHPMNKEDD